MDNLNIEIIPTPTKDGISSLAFNFKNILDNYGEEIIGIQLVRIFVKLISMAHSST